MPSTRVWMGLGGRGFFRDLAAVHPPVAFGTPRQTRGWLARRLPTPVKGPLRAGLIALAIEIAQLR